MATDKLENKTGLVIDGIEVNQEIIVGLLGNESKILQLLLNENNQFKPEALLKIAQTYPALSLIIIKNTHLRSRLSGKQLIELATIQKNHTIDPVITEELFEHYNEYGITLVELKDLALKLVALSFYSVFITPLFLKSILALIDEHVKSNFFQNDELLSLVANTHVSTALCLDSEKYQQFILNLTNAQLVLLLSAYKAHFRETKYHELMMMPKLREAVKRLDAASLMEWFMKSKGADIHALSRFIFEDEALIAKITGTHVLPFITKLDAPSENPFSQKIQSMFASLSVTTIQPTDFYRYILLVRIYAPENLNTTLNEIALRMKQEEAIRFIPVEEIINFAAMSSHLHKTICAALVRVDQFKDDQGALQYSFNLKQLDTIIEAISPSATPESLSILIKYMKSKMNSKFVDANLASKSYVHAVATIDAFLEHNPVPGPTARVVIANLCKKNPQIAEYIQEHSANNYLVLKGIIADEQKKTAAKVSHEPERRQNCSIM